MNKYKEYTIEQLEEIVREVNFWDGSLEDYNYYEIEELNNLLCGLEPLEILRMAHFGEFNWNDEYFQVNAYGNLDSYRRLHVITELKDNQDKIIEHYNELVESGEIENII